MKSLRFRCIATLIISLISSSAAADERYLCRFVGESWVWFSDHVAVSVGYLTVGPEGRTYETGTGISVSGSPWGKREKRKGTAEFSAYGAGALHIRRADEGADFKVCATSSGLRPITIIQSEF